MTSPSAPTSIEAVATPEGFTVAESVFMSVCYTALQRGVGLAALVESVCGSGMGQPWVTLGELQAWCDRVDELVPGAKTPPPDFVDWCVTEGLDPVSGKRL